jgi:hypothetical protein
MHRGHSGVGRAGNALDSWVNGFSALMGKGRTRKVGTTRVHERVEIGLDLRDAEELQPEFASVRLGEIFDFG